MAIPKKDRFIKEKINVMIGGNNFPPEELKFENEILVLLGKSNKTDLCPDVIEDDGMYAASMKGETGQFCYSSLEGNLYELYLYRDMTDTIWLYSIRTRLQ